jgi:ABC-type Fe3+/spermidine/putrescine transport system ATPase subunit
MENILELREVSKHYPTQRAVHQVSFAVPRGALYSLLGPSGCGKTTTLRLIAGFDSPTQGDILLNSQPIGHLPPYERPVNTVFQSYALFPHLTVRGNIEFGLKRRNKDRIPQRVAQALELVQLAGKEDRYPHELSGGERQRVALARSLVLEPEVLLLDEPLSALDPALRKQVRTELKALQRGTGITFILITHDQEEALSLSDQIAVMNRGEIEQIGTPEEIYLRPRTRFVAGFLGQMNWINGVGVRPERTFIAREAPAAKGHPVREGRVENSVFLGNCVQIEAHLDSGDRLVAEVPHWQNGYVRGERVHLWWQPADEMRFPAEPR